MIKQTTFCLVLLAILAGKAFAQQTDTKALLEKALRDGAYKHADSLLRSKLNTFFQQRAYDSLPSYVLYVGRVEEKLGTTATAEKKIKSLIDKVSTEAGAARAIPGMYGELAEYYASIDKLDQAYNSSMQAYRLEERSASPRLAFMAALDSDMGTFSFRNGEMNLSTYHRRKTIAYYLSHPDANPESFYSAANNMASGMWMASKLDSSIYYFDIALKALARTDSTPINRYYRPAVLQNNMCAIYGVQGKTQQAIETMRACIENLRIYLSIPETVPKKTGAEGFQYMAIDNLGGIYKDLGDYSQALSLEWYSYEQKQKLIDKEPAAVYQSQILLGQLYLSMKDHANALLYLRTGLDNITKLEGDYLFWQADACASLALLYEEQHDNKKASQYYQKADSLYESSLQGEYDDIYLEFLRNAASFYVDNGQLDIALSKARKGANYIRQTQGTQSLVYFYQLTNLAELHLKAGNFKQSLDYSIQGLQIVQTEIRNSTSLLDSIKIELKKPEAVLLKVKAEYFLLKEKNREVLSQFLRELNSAVSIIERRKSVIREAKDIGVMMAGHTELLQFIKKITLDLYELTSDQAYINQLIDLQESGTYYRIRSRLDKSDSVRFAHVPPAIQQKEKELKAALQASLASGNEEAGAMQRYF
ncbi:MAG: tetratricopeptide repeat protein, partial [Chitinophagaceae bacterium]